MHEKCILLPMSAPYMRGLGKSAKSDNAEMRIVIAADLSCNNCKI